MGRQRQQLTHGVIVKKTGNRKAVRVPTIAAARVRVTQESKVSKRLKVNEPYTIIIEGTVSGMGRLARGGALTDEQERLAAIVTSFSRSGNVQWGVGIKGVLVAYRGKVLEIDIDDDVND